MSRLINRCRDSGFCRTFNFTDDMAKGRLCMLASETIVRAMQPLTSGIFYTGFLIANDIDIVKAGVINFIPFIANLFSVFSPHILEHFPKRKGLLLWARFFYYTLNILGVTLLPLLVHDTQTKILWFGVLVFASNVISALTAPGFSPWHLHFIPDSVRVDYFGYSQVVCYTVSSVTVLASGLLADALSGSSAETGILYSLRVAAFFTALAELAFLRLPKEFPYEKKEPPRLRNVFVLSFRQRKFFRVIMVMCVWVFFGSLGTSSFNYYLVNTAKIPYAYMSFMDALYPFFLFATAGYWRRFIKKHSWLKTFSITMLMHTPSLFAYSFVTHGNYPVLMTAVRLSQHISGVGLIHSSSNLPYINLPHTDRTNYVAFYTLTTNIAELAGMLLSTGYIAAAGNTGPTLLGVPFTAPQQLMFLQGIGHTLMAVGVLSFQKHLRDENI